MQGIVQPTSQSEEIEAQRMPARPATEEGDASARMRELGRVIHAYNDVTRRMQESHETLTAQVRRLQQELASANAALERSRRLAALGEMAAGIAHEIRNPLGPIQLYANMLEEDLADRPEQRRTACKIGAAVRGLDAIVHDVLRFSRELSPRLRHVSMSAMLDRAKTEAVLLCDAAGVEVSIELDADDFEVICDPELMHQALMNVLRNGVEAMKDGQGGRVTLTTEAEEHGGVTLCVRDQGPGIGEEEIERIFNPFFTTRQTGTGLGLAIVHRIVDAHGGSITVHNDDGAVFRLTLPGKQEHAEEGEG